MRISYDVFMNLIDINASRLEVKQIAGSSQLAPLVFFHEGLGSVSLWTQRGLDWPLALCKATGRAGWVYSRRGYGQSEAVPTRRPYLEADYMHREAWEVLPALLDRLQIKSPVLVGHSDGASIALLYASRHAVASCIAMAPHVLVEEAAITAITGAKVAFEAGDAVGSLRARLAKHHADSEGAFWQWNDVWLSPQFRNFDIRPACRMINAPLLLVQGLDDEYGTMLQLDEIALAAPHAVQLRLAECGHSPQRDQPQKTVTAIADFLKTVP